MAENSQLVMCASCGRDIPTLSPRCPYCGVDLADQAFPSAPESWMAQHWGLIRFAGGLLLGLLVVLALAYLGIR